MKNIFLIIALAFIYSNAMAHNPLTAKFELDAAVEDGAILHVYLSQTGLHQALVKYYSEKDLTTISANEYKKLAVQYVKKYTAITANQQLLTLGEGGIKLGNHQTNFKFLIKNYPAAVTDLAMHINAFQENENHHTMFWWNRKGIKSKVILSAKNEFKGTLNLTAPAAVSEVTTYGNLLKIGIGAAILLIFLSGRFYFKRQPA